MGKCIFNLLSRPCTLTKSKPIAFLSALFPRISLRLLKLGDHTNARHNKQQIDWNSATSTYSTDYSVNDSIALLT